MKEKLKMILFVLIMGSILSTALVGVDAYTAPFIEKNKVRKLRVSILKALDIPYSKDEVEKEFTENVETKQAEYIKMIGEPAFRGKGAAQEATRLILSYGFRTLGLNRIYLRTRGGNLKNIRLNERMGFRFEVVLEEAALFEGRLTDVVLMGMLRREFEPPTAE